MLRCLPHAIMRNTASPLVVVVGVAASRPSLLGLIIPSTSSCLPLFLPTPRTPQRQSPHYHATRNSSSPPPFSKQQQQQQKQPTSVALIRCCSASQRKRCLVPCRSTPSGSIRISRSSIPGRGAAAVSPRALVAVVRKYCYFSAATSQSRRVSKWPGMATIITSGEEGMQRRDTTITGDKEQQEEDVRVSYLTQAEAISVDEELMGPLGFTIDQLMELAGLSVACAVAEVYGVERHGRVLVVCGPGNNGGDGLVAARHLHHFGYRPTICYPIRTPKPLYHHLLTQVESLQIPLCSPQDLSLNLADDFDLIIDAIFGFSFRGQARAPFDEVLKRLVGAAAQQKSVPVVSVDIPSGWDVELGHPTTAPAAALQPHMLVSLTAPKRCAQYFQGPHHFLGGRFVPPAIREKYNLQLPAFPGSAMCVRIGRASPLPVDVASLREDYAGGSLLEIDVNLNPIQQFRCWFEEAVAAGIAEPNAMVLATSTPDATPSARLVLLKGYDDNGFVWFTNYNSRKGKELEANPKAALVFWWSKLQRSVRVEGSVERVSADESDAYFHSRPWQNQLGALASPQSSAIGKREELEMEYGRLAHEFQGREIERPDTWGGFRLRPHAIEFWQGRQSRLHDRLKYVAVPPASPCATEDDHKGGVLEWRITRLAP